MRNTTFAVITLVSAILLLSSCKKEEAPSGNTSISNTTISIDQLYGTWYGTHYLTSSGWITIGRSTFSATFYPDGSYSGSGILGTGTGLYIVSGRTITTYVDGEEFYKYDILEFTDTTAHLKLYRGSTQAEIANSTKEIKVAKEASVIAEPTVDDGANL